MDHNSQIACRAISLVASFESVPVHQDHLGPDWTCTRSILEARLEIPQACRQESGSSRFVNWLPSIA